MMASEARVSAPRGKRVTVDSPLAAAFRMSERWPMDLSPGDSISSRSVDGAVTRAVSMAGVVLRLG